jgi:hypothetical protein
LPGLNKFTNSKGYYKNKDQLIKQLYKDVAIEEKITGCKPISLVLRVLKRYRLEAVDLLKRIGCRETKK